MFSTYTLFYYYNLAVETWERFWACESTVCYISQSVNHLCESEHCGLHNISTHTEHSKTQYTPPTTHLSSWVASAVGIELAIVSTSLDKFADNEVELRRIGGVNEPVGSRDPVYSSAATAYGCRIVNWVTTADGCVHTDDTTQLGRINSQRVHFVQFPHFRPNRSAVLVS